MTPFKKLLLAGMASVALAAGGASGANASSTSHYRQVLLISIDGFHRVDLERWVQTHPAGPLAQLSRHGTTYGAAETTLPSDSFPGMVAQVTGATPRTAGVFYDDSFDRTLYAPGSNCSGKPGTETQFAENIDKNKTLLDAGGTIGNPLSQIDPKQLPMRLAGGKCEVVYPHQFIRTNTVFEVIHAHGGRTAWSDKHPAYEILSGPSGKGIDDLFAPEINSDIPGHPGDDNTTSYKAVRDYDAIKVQAVINEIDGVDSTGVNYVGVPNIMGMNFQAVSVGQKLAKSGVLDPAGLTGGYVDASGTPGKALTQQIQFVDDSIGQMVDELKSQGIFGSTLIIISAKHGQSPIDVKLRRALDDTPYTKAPGYAFHVADDEALVWLAPQTQKSDYAAAEAYIKDHAAQLGAKTVLDRSTLATIFQDPFTDSRTPDFFVVTDKGVIYTSGTKLAEHGGAADDDRHVALLVSAPGLPPISSDKPVETRQIAPTILYALGLEPSELEGVRLEGTRGLPDLW